MNTENSKNNESVKFVLNLSPGLAAPINMLLLKIYLLIAPTWNYEFESPDGSYSVHDIQDYIG